MDHTQTYLQATGNAFLSGIAFKNHPFPTGSASLLHLSFTCNLLPESPTTCLGMHPNFTCPPTGIASLLYLHFTCNLLPESPMTCLGIHPNFTCPLQGLHPCFTCISIRKPSLPHLSLAGNSITNSPVSQTEVTPWIHLPFLRDGIQAPPASHPESHTLFTIHMFFISDSIQSSPAGPTWNSIPGRLSPHLHIIPTSHIPSWDPIPY